MAMFVTDYIYPVSSVILCFLCIFLCIRFLVTRRSLVWLIPLVLTLALLFGSMVSLAAATSVGDLIGPNGLTVTVVASDQTEHSLAMNLNTYLSLFLFGLSVIWFITLIAFSMKTRDEDLKASQEKKRLRESAYIRKRAMRFYPKKVDPRATAQSTVKPVNSVQKAENARAKDRDLYTAGPLKAASLKKTAFQ